MAEPARTFNQHACMACGLHLQDETKRCDMCRIATCSKPNSLCVERNKWRKLNRCPGEEHKNTDSLKPWVCSVCQKCRKCLLGDINLRFFASDPWAKFGASAFEEDQAESVAGSDDEREIE